MANGNINILDVVQAVLQGAGTGFSAFDQQKAEEQRRRLLEEQNQRSQRRLELSEERAQRASRGEARELIAPIVDDPAVSTERLEEEAAGPRSIAPTVPQGTTGPRGVEAETIPTLGLEIPGLDARQEDVAETTGLDPETVEQITRSVAGETATERKQQERQRGQAIEDQVEVQKLIRAVQFDPTVDISDSEQVEAVNERLATFRAEQRARDEESFELEKKRTLATVRRADAYIASLEEDQAEVRVSSARILLNNRVRTLRQENPDMSREELYLMAGDQLSEEAILENSPQDAALIEREAAILGMPTGPAATIGEEVPDLSREDTDIRTRGDLPGALGRVLRDAGVGSVPGLPGPGGGL